MSVRESLTAALKTRLETISTTNGYTTNAGERVYVWRRYAVDQTDTPCLLVSDVMVRRVGQQIMGQVRNILTYEVVGLISDASPEMASSLEADIILCLGGWTTGGGLVDLVQVSQSEFVMEQTNRLVAAVKITVVAEYYTTESQC